MMPLIIIIFLIIFFDILLLSRIHTYLDRPHSIILLLIYTLMSLGGALLLVSGLITITTNPSQGMGALVDLLYFFYSLLLTGIPLLNLLLISSLKKKVHPIVYYLVGISIPFLLWMTIFGGYYDIVKVLS